MRSLIAVGLLGVLITAGSACRREDADAKKHTRVRALVVERLVPIGKAVVTAADDGSLRTTEVPGDLVPDDALTSVEGIKCLVAAQGLPRGTVLRRSMFVEPAKLGLTVGLTGGSDRPAGC